MNSEFTIAIHALVFLNHKKTTQTSEDIAKNICTNAARIRKVLAKLKKADLVAAKEGKEGGYYLTRMGDSIQLLEVLNALSLPLFSNAWESGAHDMDCLIASGMSQVMTNIYKDMGVLCHNYLSTITIQDMELQCMNYKS